MVAENTPTVKSPAYYLTRAQLQQALECAIDGHQEYIAEHGLSAEAAIIAGINEVFEGLDADLELHRCDGEPLTLQEADPAQRIAALERQLFQARAMQVGRYAFHLRHLALSWVRQNYPEICNAAFAASYDAIKSEGALAYEDVVARLEAQVEALRDAATQAYVALNEAHALIEKLIFNDHVPVGTHRWQNETGPAAIAALEKVGVQP